jgi:hypothetical protein
VPSARDAQCGLDTFIPWRGRAATARRACPLQTNGATMNDWQWIPGLVILVVTALSVYLKYREGLRGQRPTPLPRRSLAERELETKDVLRPRIVPPPLPRRRAKQTAPEVRAIVLEPAPESRAEKPAAKSVRPALPPIRDSVAALLANQKNLRALVALREVLGPPLSVRGRGGVPRAPLNRSPSSKDSPAT